METLKDPKTAAKSLVDKIFDQTFDFGPLMVWFATAYVIEVYDRCSHEAATRTAEATWVKTLKKFVKYVEENANKSLLPLEFEKFSHAVEDEDLETVMNLLSDKTFASGIASALGYDVSKIDTALKYFNNVSTIKETIQQNEKYQNIYKAIKTNPLLRYILEAMLVEMENDCSKLVISSREGIYTSAEGLIKEVHDIHDLITDIVFKTLDSFEPSGLL